MWDAGTKAYAAIVDDEEAEDLDILDISDPRKPKLIAEYDLEAAFPQIVQDQAGLSSVFLHDMVVKNVEGKWLMIASYWDGGYVVLDVTNPARATYVGDSDFTVPDPEAAESGLTVDPEGNAHYAEFTKDSGFIVAADEDFDPYKAVTRNVDDGTTFTAVPGSDTPGVPVGGSIAGGTVYVGLACGRRRARRHRGGPDRRGRAGRVHVPAEARHRRRRGRLRGGDRVQPRGLGRRLRHSHHDAGEQQPPGVLRGPAGRPRPVRPALRPGLLPRGRRDEDGRRGHRHRRRRHRHGSTFDGWG